MRLWIFLISSLLLSLASINGSASFSSNTQSLTPLDTLDSLLAGKRQFKLNNPDEFFRHRELLVKDLKPPKERWANCVERFSKPYNWPQEDTEQLKLEIWRCNDLLLSMPDKNGEFLADLTNLFITWSSGSEHIWSLPNSNIPFPQWYQSLSNVSNLALWYSFYEDKLPLSSKQKTEVRKYLKSYLLEASYIGGNPLSQRPCPQNAEQITSKDVNTNFCGSVRFKMATGKLALGFKLEDKNLIKSGIKGLEIILQAHDSEGYFVPYSPSKKQGYAFSYYHRQAKFLSVLTELMAMRGYDFLSFKMPSGATIGQSIEFNRNVAINDHRILGKYPGDGSTYGGDPWSDWNRLKTLDHQTFILENDDNDGLFDPANRQQQFASNNPRFALTEFPALFVRTLGYQQRAKDDFSPINPLSIMLGDTTLSHSEVAKAAVNNLKDQRLRETLREEIVTADRIAQNVLTQQSKLESGIIFHGLISDLSDGWKLQDASERTVDSWKLKEIIPPNKPGKSSKYKFKIQVLGKNGKVVFRGRATLYKKDADFKVGMAITNLVEKGRLDYDNWKSLMKKCNALDAEESQMELPLFSSDDELQAKGKCILANNTDEQIKDLIKTVIATGNFMMLNHE